jgi:hypothetical protein
MGSAVGGAPSEGPIFSCGGVASDWWRAIVLSVLCPMLNGCVVETFRRCSFADMVWHFVCGCGM